MKKWLDTVRLSCVFAGVSLIFYGTRYLDGQPSSTGFLVGGFSLITAAIALAIYLMRAAELSAERQSRRLTVWWGLSLLIGYGLLILYRKLLGSAAEPETNMQRVLLGLWVSILLVSIFWGIGLEWAFRLSGRGRFAEPRRVERAGRTWILVGLLLGSIVALNYVAVRKNRSWDWSYLKTAKASGATVKILGSLEKDLKVGLFFPATNEVTSHIRTYFDALPASESKVKIQYFDADLNPTAAEEFKASRNGQVILKFGDATERIEFGATLTAARKNLRNLDAEFQKALLAATQKRKVLYFTRGHGELAWTGSDGDPMKSIKLLEGFLRGQNYTMKYFGVGEGSAKSVPDDADAVVVIGGTTSMLPEEVSAIGAYVDKGGSLLAMLDMDAPSDGVLAKTSRDISNDLFVKFLADKGVRYTPTPLANAENFVAATRSDADSWFLFTNVFTSHESISSMARNDQRTVLLTFRSGYLSVTSELSGWQNFETVRSLSDTFVDENRDFKFKEGAEKRNAYVMGVATIRKEGALPGGKRGKMITLADASAGADVLIRNQGNLVYIVEALRWLVGDQKSAAGAGVAVTEEDVRIQHTRKEDIAWFYGTVLVVPLLVLGMGFLATRRVRRKQAES